MKQFRQGDVFLVERKEPIPSCVSVRDSGHVAEGEVTGHFHGITDLASADVLVGPGGELYLAVKDEHGVTIEHQEHGPITIPAGNYDVRIQREYTPEELRSVLD